MESVKGYTSDHNIVTFAHCYSAIKRFQMTEDPATLYRKREWDCGMLNTVEWSSVNCLKRVIVSVVNVVTLSSN